VSAPNAVPKGAPIWPRVVLLGLGYFVIGVVTAALSRSAASDQMRQVWRLAAWLVSAALFGRQIWYERVRRGGAAANAALRAALAVALGGFLLAVAATVHWMSAGAGRPVAHVVALVAWPVLLGLPAFLVAWAAAAVLAPRKRV
jgi:hypothetical protein